MFSDHNGIKLDTKKKKRYLGNAETFGDQRKHGSKK